MYGLPAATHVKGNEGRGGPAPPPPTTLKPAERETPAPPIPSKIGKNPPAGKPGAGVTEVKKIPATRFQSHYIL